MSRRTIIVGASSSIGEHVLRSFNERGDSIIGTYNRGCILKSAGMQLVSLDLSNSQSIEQFCDAIVRQFAPVDNLIILSGALPGLAIEHYTWEKIQETISVNLSGCIYLIKAILGYMRKGGCIICLSSISAERGSFDAVYAASKAGIVGMVKSIAVWHGADVRINCIAPGLVEDSSMFKSMSPERREFHRDRVPNKTLLRASDLARLIRDLTEDHWGHLNGITLRLNGGAYT
jgi:3-oxoacyl-[acyl-carrier protein] reductase